MGKKGFAVSRQTDAVGVAVKQPTAEHLFEALQMLAEEPELKVAFEQWKSENPELLADQHRIMERQAAIMTGKVQGNPVIIMPACRVATLAT